MRGEEKLTRNLDAEFPGNSNRRKDPEKKAEPQKVQQVTKGKVIKQKKSFGQKLSETFLGDDTQSIGDYLLHDVLIPAFKSTLNELVGGGMEMLLFGERRPKGTYRDRGRSYISYGGYFGDRDNRRDREGRDNRREIDNRARARQDFDDIVLETRGEAEDVLSHMVDMVQDYGVATIANYYDLLGEESQYTDSKFGWTNLRDASVDRVRNGYLIKMPRPRELD